MRRSLVRLGGSGDNIFPNKLKLFTDWAQRLVKPQTPGTLILVRHGESEWNKENRFTGWCDVDLSDLGTQEMVHAARLLLERGYIIDVAYTSLLKRSIRSTWILLKELDQQYRPVHKSWRLNERHYGDLEGKPKGKLASTYGEELVQQWRSSLNIRPPEMKPGHDCWHGNERKYRLAGLTPEQIPRGESLQDIIDRITPLWTSEIEKSLKDGKTVLIVTHAHSIRGIIKQIERMSAEDITKVRVPNGIPLVYKFDNVNDMRPVLADKSNFYETFPLSGEYLEKRGLLKLALAREADWYGAVPGYYSHSSMHTSTMSDAMNDPVVNKLFQLDGKRRLIESSTSISSSPSSITTERINNNNYDNINISINTEKDTHSLSLSTENSIQNITPKSFDIQPTIGVQPSAVNSTSKATTTKTTTTSLTESQIQALRLSSQSLTSKRPLIVIIRHGKTEHNKLGLFTGWEDAPLAVEGKAEAVEAGRLLRLHGIEFDIVYTSWLSRAMETAWIVLDEMDCLWLPIVKTWRLNERMYGALTGLSKKMIKQRHGERQFNLWRRGYDTKPPPVSSFSAHYPGNDERYVKYVHNAPISVFESVVRSIAHGNLEIHRDFPKSESLKDCMERTIPYLKNVIEPNAIKMGKNVLIASSENAIRGLLMHLCEIPTSMIQELNIPTGVPLVFDTDRKCIRLLDDGSGVDPLTKYNFGSSPELLEKLFKPDSTAAGIIRA